MIPKKIHYVWVGEKEKPPIVISCIESWKKYCPDYEFIEWNNKSLSQIETNNYVREAFESKKWAFVSDYWNLAVFGTGAINGWDKVKITHWDNSITAL